MSVSTADEPMVSLRKEESLSISPELFEKLYLSPKNKVKGNLRETFGNPTPLALVGFLVALSPISAELMGWRGAAGLAATGGVNIYFGGMLLIICGFLEFFLGNTFPAVVFMSYGAHFVVFHVTLIPFYGAVSSYTDPTNPTQVQTPGFLNSYAFYVVFMGVLSFIFLILSLRTNACFVLIFTGATMGFAFAAGAFWNLTQGNITLGNRLLQATGGAFFVAAMVGWYLLCAIMFAIMDLPFLNKLPVVDLSTLIKGASEKNSAKAE